MNEKKTPMPERIQRRRTKGWRMPPNTKYVGRPGRFGNRFIVGQVHVCPEVPEGHHLTSHDAVSLYRAAILEAVEGFPTAEEIREELAGWNLADWCREGDPCHADVLLEIANPNGRL